MCDKTGKNSPTIEDEEQLRERVPPQKASTGWDGVTSEDRERILKNRRRIAKIRAKQSEMEKDNSMGR